VETQPYSLALPEDMFRSRRFVFLDALVHSRILACFY
jgi:hypothetical protein